MVNNVDSQGFEWYDDFMKIIMLICGVILSFVSLSLADVYQYTSEDGVICYTDLPFGKKADLVMKDKKDRSESPLSQQKYERTDYKDTEYYQGIIHEKASKYNVDASLVKAVIKTESNWNERAVSRIGAVGLMQLMPSTANDMNVRNPFRQENEGQGREPNRQTCPDRRGNPHGKHH